MLSVLSKLKSILRDLEIEVEVRILLKKTQNNIGKEASMHFLLQI